MQSPDPENQSRTENTDRRRFFKKALATALGSIAVLAPTGAGIALATDPLRRKAAVGGQLVRVATLDALPDDGVPRRFSVIAAKTDAWTRFDATPIGAVYLRRRDGQVEALNVVCPHAGCFVDFEQGTGLFRCPCHHSVFDEDGTIADPRSPSPRAMDTLPVTVDNDGVVWVTFQNFQAGRPDKVPLA